MSAIPYGLCRCGCGQRTNIRNGRANRFVHGHNSRGKNHPSWSGGRIETPDGYIKVLRPRHHRANPNGYVPEHIVVVERALGRPLPEGAEVHHVSEDPADNRPQNLVVCQDHEYHMLLHVRQRAYDACGHADWVRCDFCGEYTPAEEQYVHRKGARRLKSYHRACRRAFNRNRTRTPSDAYNGTNPERIRS